MAKQQSMRLRPEGWPVGSFETYEQAQKAVDLLSDRNFPVGDLTIVGVNLMEVERVIGRLTWGRVIFNGVASGAWMGLFFGLLLGILGGEFLVPMLTGVLLGAVFGVVLAVVPYAASGGRRDFTSRTQIVAGRYDVLCAPANAPEARDVIAGSGIAGPVQRSFPQGG